MSEHDVITSRAHHGAPAWRLPLWLYYVRSAALREAYERLFRAERMEVADGPPSVRRRSERSRLIREALLSIRTIHRAVEIASAWALPAKIPVQTTTDDEIRQRMTSVRARNRSKNQ